MCCFKLKNEKELIASTGVVKLKTNNNKDSPKKKKKIQKVNSKYEVERDVIIVKWNLYNVTLARANALDLKDRNESWEFIKEAWVNNKEYHPPLYTVIEPFFVLNITTNVSINIYMGVKKKLTSQQPLTIKEIKSSRNTWKSKNSLPKNPAL